MFENDFLFLFPGEQSRSIFWCKILEKKDKRIDKCIRMETYRYMCQCINVLIFRVVCVEVVWREELMS